MIKLLLLSLLLLSCACQNSGLKGNPVTPPADFKGNSQSQLTFTGINTSPSISKDENTVIYLSQSRSTHKNTQVYLLDLKTHRERRLTFNNGDDMSPKFSPTGKKILYASTTDEVKESSVAATKDIKPSFEIYLADTDGSHIQRLTRNPGYDAEGNFSSDGNHIVFSSTREGSGDTDIYLMDSSGKNQKKIIKAKASDIAPSLSPNGKQILWSQHQNKGKTAQILISDINATHIKSLTTKEALHLNPSWSKDGKKIIFSSNRDDINNFELYLVNSDGTCLKRITYAQGDDIQPTFTVKGNKILFSSQRSGSAQIYLLDFAEPEKCLEEAP